MTHFSVLASSPAQAIESRRTMNATTLTVLVYVLASLAIGAWIGRRVRSEDDYLVAGRTLGYGLGTFTIFATWFGAESCIGSAGSIYAEGLAGGTADPFGYGLCVLLMGLVFAVPLWRLRLTTLGDLFRRRFSPGVEQLAVMLMIPTSVLWAAAQVRAFAQVLAVSSGWTVEVTLTLAAAVVIVYTMMGGLLADAWTDLVQGIALLTGLGVLAAAVLARPEAGAALAALEPGRLSLAGPPGTSPWTVLEAWAIPVCGSVLAAELVARVIACRSPAVARRSALAAGSVYLVVGLVPVTLGLVGPALLPDLDHPEQLLPRLAQTLLPAPLFALFAGALVSAILSTVDSALLAAGSLFSHNLLVRWLGGDVDDRRRLRLARASVVLFGLAAYGLAWHAEGVYALVEEASAFASAGIFVVVVAGLARVRGGPPTAYAALGAGTAAWVLGAYVLAWEHPYLISLAAAGGGYGVLALAGFGNAASVGSDRETIH